MGPEGCSTTLACICSRSTDGRKEAISSGLFANASDRTDATSSVQPPAMAPARRGFFQPAMINSDSVIRWIPFRTQAHQAWERARCRTAVPMRPPRSVRQPPRIPAPTNAAVALPADCAPAPCNDQGRACCHVVICRTGTTRTGGPCGPRAGALKTRPAGVVCAAADDGACRLQAAAGVTAGPARAAEAGC
jgi:hypothetical protein